MQPNWEGDAAHPSLILSRHPCNIQHTWLTTILVSRISGWLSAEAEQASRNRATDPMKFALPILAWARFLCHKAEFLQAETLQRAFRKKRRARVRGLQYYLGWAAFD